MILYGPSVVCRGLSLSRGRMLMRRFLLLLLLVLPLFPNEQTEPVVTALVSEPRVSAQSYVLMDADTGKIWAALKPDVRLPMASTTKIMTAYVAIRLTEGDLSQKVTVTDAHVRVEGSRMYLRAGEKLSLEELLYGLMLASGNDAALAIAEGLCGSVGKFVEEMNRTAKELGLDDTHFTNPSGLPDDNHYTTARDMAKLMSVAMQNPLFAKITGTREKVLTGRTVVNHNRLLKTYPGLDGGKTGFTKAAGRCLVTTATRNGRRLVVVTLNAPSDWNDHKALYDYGFCLYSKEMVFSKGPVPVSLNVVGSLTQTVPLYADEDVSLTLTASEKQDIKAVYYLPKFVYAPVEKGKQVGWIEFVSGGHVFATVKLYTAEGAEYYSAKSR